MAWKLAAEIEAVTPRFTYIAVFRSDPAYEFRKKAGVLRVNTEHANAILRYLNHEESDNDRRTATVQPAT